jgi:mRNA interferase YafQ
MLTPRRSGAFKRDVRKAEKRGKDMVKLRAVLALLIDGKPLQERYKDHALKGGW